MECVHVRLSGRSWKIVSVRFSFRLQYTSKMRSFLPEFFARYKGYNGCVGRVTKQRQLFLRRKEYTLQSQKKKC